MSADGRSPNVYGHDGCYVTVAFATGDNTEWLRPAAFDLEAIGVPYTTSQSARARIRIVDWSMGSSVTTSTQRMPVSTGPGSVSSNPASSGANVITDSPSTAQTLNNAPALSPPGTLGHINVDAFSFQDAPPPPPTAPRFPVFGFVDTHAHPFAGMGFGGRLIAGSVGGNWRTSSIATDLPSDPDSRHGGATFAAQGVLMAIEMEALSDAPGRVTADPLAAGCSIITFFGSAAPTLATALIGVPEWVTTGNFIGTLVNLAPLLSRTAGVCVGPIANEVVTHYGGGYPDFEGYPKFYTKVHQQMHVSFMRRAYEGGQRLMCALVVNDGLLEYMMGLAGGRVTSDREQVIRQIEALRDLVRLNSDWMEIALDPDQARRIIRENKLAIVIGTEVDGNGSMAATVENEISFLFGLGVRQMTPVHLANNALGGSAIYNNLFNTNTQFLNRTAPLDPTAWYRVEEGCPANPTGLPNTNCIQYKLSPDQYAVTDQELPFLGPLPGGAGLVPLAVGVTMPDYNSFNGHRNARALTEMGSEYIRGMMRRGMLIDVDHMGSKTTDDVLGIGQRNDYPIMSSHSGFRELKWRRSESSESEKWPSETHKTRGQVRAIAALGGIISPNTGEPEMRDFDGPNGVQGFQTPGATVVNNAAGSSRSFAQAYLYALSIGGGGVGLGTDMNGMAGAPAPRFGTYAAHGLHDDELRLRLGAYEEQIAHQFNGVRYDRPLIDYRYHRFRATPQTQRKRDATEALAIVTAGVSPDHAWQPGGWQRTFVQREIIKNYARGFAARTESSLGTGCNAASNSCNEQRAAFLVRRNYELALADPSRLISEVRIDLSAENDSVREMFTALLPVYIHWKGFADSTANAPLRRHVLATPGGIQAEKDFDINLDGLAHYGMLPDFIQDLKNVGLPEYALSALFNSAEKYIEMWEKAVTRANGFGPAGPRP